MITIALCILAFAFGIAACSIGDRIGMWFPIGCGMFAAAGIALGYYWGVAIDFGDFIDGWLMYLAMFALYGAGAGVMFLFTQLLFGKNHHHQQQ